MFVDTLQCMSMFVTIQVYDTKINRATFLNFIFHNSTNLYFHRILGGIFMGFATEIFSKRLRELREIAELTQAQLANELKVSRGAISYYEKGERTPDIEFLTDVSELFSVSLEYLLGYTDNIEIEHCNLYETYGLTDTVLDKLEDNDKIGHILSNILTNSSFKRVETLLGNAIEDYKIYDSTAIKYLSFILSTELQELIAKALHDELYAQYTEKDNEELMEKVNEALKKYDDFFKHSLIEDVSKAIIETSNHEIENLEKMKSSTKYIARSKVHKALRKTIW